MSVNVVRAAVEDDGEEVLRLLRELASLSNGQFRMDIDRFRRDGFGENRKFHCLVVDSPTCPKELIGVLVYIWFYSTWIGEVLYIEDIYVADGFRRQGIGSALFLEAIKIAEAKHCPRLQWMGRNWNAPALQFYQNTCTGYIRGEGLQGVQIDYRRDEDCC
ncbi:thialysine N-epsilon-acetyltransferase-like [Haliotis rubra]|uniref:thialysine N-epsilon-acetyltransferase-like n=1 Tax=Haliotis rubra TaxID=36100 RepID=UPI001EE62140|nr:thialysine N-epsilon-acetyltransferase-like [Haliotis rubra]